MKTMPQRWTALMAALLLVLTAACALAESNGTCGENLTWALDDGGTLTISGSGEMEDYLNATGMPWFDVRAQILSVVLGEGVKGIGDNAFVGLSATSVSIPEGVKGIGDNAFVGLSATSVSIPEGVMSIGDNAFRGCESLTDVQLRRV